MFEKCSPFLCEFLGTFLLVFTVGCNCLSPPSVFSPLSIACVLMVSIYAFGAVSGGHLNPSVSLAVGFSKKAPWTTIFGYIGAQLLAGIMASLCFWALFLDTVQLGPKDNYGWWEVGIVEA